jgi:hypothetical protein
MSNRNEKNNANTGHAQRTGAPTTDSVPSSSLSVRPSNVGGDKEKHRTWRGEESECMTWYDLSPEWQEGYKDLDENSKRYPLKWFNDAIRFKPNVIVRFLIDKLTEDKPRFHGDGRFDLNNLWNVAYKEHWPVEDMRQVYRMMGYSLSGFLEVFHDAGRDENEFLGDENDSAL